MIIFSGFYAKLVANRFVPGRGKPFLYRFAGNNRRLLEFIGNVPPAGFEMMYYERLKGPSWAA
jgi:hypothetical protein